MIVLCGIVFLLWSHVAVYSQTVPYITFMGVTLPNNSYVNASLVGNPISGGAGVQCHTDLTTCCSRDQGMDRGDWYAPDTERLPFYHVDNYLSAAFEQRGNQTVTLYQRSSFYVDSGIYRCDIAVHGSGRGTVYIGLYDTGGNIIDVSFSVY